LNRKPSDDHIPVIRSAKMYSTADEESLAAEEANRAEVVSGQTFTLIVDPTCSPGERVRELTGLAERIFNDEALKAPKALKGLSKEIWLFFTSTRLTRPGFLKKLELWCTLDDVLRQRWPHSRSMAFGSTLNGLGSDDSDLDLCVFMDFDEGVVERERMLQERMLQDTLSKKQKNIIKRGSVELLIEIRRSFKSKLGYFHSRIIPANVPILEFQLGFLQVDVSCNSPGSSFNTHLLFCYGQMDWRVRPLVLTIKQWAKSQDINDASQSTLSSYVISLFVIAYLQIGVQPAILPSLQECHPETFKASGNIFQLPYLTPLPTESNSSANKATLAQLMSGFFDWFLRLDHQNDVASVRLGKMLTRADCERYAKQNGLTVGQWFCYMSIEEPFERSNAARATVQRPAFDRILRAFEDAQESLNKGTFNLQEVEANMRMVRKS